MRFTKMQGVGNDFVVLDAAALPEHILLPDLAIRLCNRNFGVGADGLLIVSPEPGSGVITMRMFNPDGTEDTCGNGLRCVGLWAYRAGWLEDRTKVVVQTKDGAKTVRLLTSALPNIDSNQGGGAMLGVDMGLPYLEPSRIPFAESSVTGRVVNWPLWVEDREWPITSVNTGSTHTVIFGDAPDEETFQRYSPLIENHPTFPERTSILWATQKSATQFDVRIWERGVGETLGCGTGACAVGVAAQLTGLSQLGMPLEIVSKGGVLQVTWPGEGKTVDMVGPAQFVFEGELCL